MKLQDRRRPTIRRARIRFCGATDLHSLKIEESSRSRLGGLVYSFSFFSEECFEGDQIFSE